MHASQRLNYHHLLYFHAIAREGSISAAARRLRLSQSTLSAQLALLEDDLGTPLFTRVGRHLELTAAGHTARVYAAEILALGQELRATVRAGGPDRRLLVGVSDALPKLLVARLLTPCLESGVQLAVSEGDVGALLAELVSARLDIVLADAPVPAGGPARLFNHPLGESLVSIVAAPALAGRLVPGFPGSLDGAPMLLPAAGAPLRRALDEWLRAEALAPRVVAEVHDSALLKSLGSTGAGAFAVPTAVLHEVCRQHDVVVLGQAGEARERLWAITADRRIRHPAAAALVGAARAWARPVPVPEAGQ